MDTTDRCDKCPGLSKCFSGDRTSEARCEQVPIKRDCTRYWRIQVKEWKKLQSLHKATKANQFTTKPTTDARSQHLSQSPTAPAAEKNIQNANQFTTKPTTDARSQHLSQSPTAPAAEKNIQNANQFTTKPTTDARSQHLSQSPTAPAAEKNIPNACDCSPETLMWKCSFFVVLIILVSNILWQWYYFNYRKSLEWFPCVSANGRANNNSSASYNYVGNGSGTVRLNPGQQVSIGNGATTSRRRIGRGCQTL